MNHISVEDQHKKNNNNNKINKMISKHLEPAPHLRYIAQAKNSSHKQ